MKDISDLVTRFSQAGDEEKIVELLRKSFVKWEKVKDPVRYWNWKFKDTPLGSRNVLSIIDNKIIGCDHNILYRAKLGEAVEPIRWGDDEAVDSEYRGLGLTRKMSEFQLQAPQLSKYVYSTSGNPIILGKWKRDKRVRFPFLVVRMVRIHDVDLHLKMRPMKDSIKIKYGYIILKILNKLVQIFTSSIKRGDDFTFKNLSKFEGEVDVFWDQVKDDYKFILEKKQTYLNWRISDPQWGTYFIVQAMKEDAILGYMIMRLMEEDGYKEGFIVDLIAQKDRIDVIDALQEYACNFFDDQNINVIYYQFVKDHPYQKLSKKRGFLESGSIPYINFNYSRGSGFEGEIKFFVGVSPSEVYFSYGDTV